MKNPTQKKHKRSRVVSFLLLPSVIFFWFLGWGLYCTGSKKEAGKPKQQSAVEKIAFTVATPKEQYAT
jgi:hypothetical protein